jgi:lipopolysaccharide export system protein LptA
MGVISTIPVLALPSRSASPSPPLASAAPAKPGTAAEPSRNEPRSGLVTIESDQQQADNVTGVVTAIGNVRITYPDRGMVATARQAQYYTREGRLVLSGDVDVIDRDGQRLRAEQIVFLLNGQRLVALPAKGQQVQTRLRLETRSGSASPRPLLP